MSAFIYSGTNEARLMKVVYGQFEEKQFNKDNVLFARLKKNEAFEGSQIEFPVEQSIGGGIAAGDLPVAATNKIGKVTLTSKKLYSLALIDRESMKAARSDKGAFIQATKYPIQTAVKAMHRNLERMLVTGDITGTGALIVGSASNSNVSGAGSAGDPYIINFSVASTYFPSEFEAIEEGDSLNVNTETTALEVTAVAVTEASGYATATVSLVGTSARLATLTGANPFTSTDKLYIQKSKDNELIGLQGVLAATSSTAYGISVGRRWQAYQKNASSAALSSDLINDVVINVKRRCGESPKLIMTSFHQFTKLLNILEDQKVYNLPARDPKFAGEISFSAIQVMTPDGAIPVIPNRFMKSDRIFFLNDDKMELHLRPGGLQWVDEAGTVFMLKDAADQYEARYQAYGQFFCNPHFQGYLYGLAV